MRGEHLMRHRRQPLLLLLLVRRRGRVTVLLELVDGHDGAPLRGELLRARPGVCALEQAAFVAELRVTEKLAVRKGAHRT